MSEEKIEAGPESRFVVCWGLRIYYEDHGSFKLLEVKNPPCSITWGPIPTNYEEFKKAFGPSCAPCTVFEVIVPPGKTLTNLGFLIKPDYYNLHINDGVQITMYQSPYLYAKEKGYSI